MIEDGVRLRLRVLAEERNVSLAALSRMLGCDPSYLRNFLNRGSPRILPERFRGALAAFFGVAEAELGGPATTPGPLRLPRLDLAASAGPGALVDGETLVGTEAVDPALARELGLRDGRASVVRVRGASMEPLLRDGDTIVVNHDDVRPGRQGGVYVIRIGEAVMVKRVRLIGGKLAATSDNRSADPVPAGPVEVIGRVVWQMRRV